MYTTWKISVYEGPEIYFHPDLHVALSAPINNEAANARHTYIHTFIRTKGQTSIYYKLTEQTILLTFGTS